MTQGQPGLEPGRKLTADGASFTVVSNDPERATDSKFKNVQSTVEQKKPQVEENTPIQEPTYTEDKPKQEAQEEQPVTERASQRIQALDERAKQAEARALTLEAQQAATQQMLSRLVNIPVTQPVISQDELLAKQYKSYNASLGYPEDPKEYVDFNRTQAALAAQQVAERVTRQQVDNDDLNRAISLYPELTTDTVLQALVAGKRAEAQRQGYVLSYAQATDLSKKELTSRYTKQATADAVSDTQAKNEAYVEGTRGASTNRQSVKTPSVEDINKMTPAEMERYLRTIGEW